LLPLTGRPAAETIKKSGPDAPPRDDFTYPPLNYRAMSRHHTPREPFMRQLAVRLAIPLTGMAVLAASLAAAPDQGRRARAEGPKAAGPARDAQLAIKRFRLPAGLRADLVAAEPLLANPVCFCFDEKGRLFVAETFRLHAGVTDDRNHPDWLNDDLASRTVADRLALYHKRLGDRFHTFEKARDRVRLLEDTDGDGVMDKASVFADDFHRAEDGLGAGLLARGGNVWYTCIPDLWLLRDTKGTGKADFRKSLQTGYGVHVSFIGHDLHGLTFGPDGRLYFSVGDRGLHVEAGGRTVSCPDSGAVLRCEPDGLGLELVATGLRNPQELAFDKFGNLFTCDNNADSGDAARWVQIVEGGDSGWRIGYQYMRGPGAVLGPWNSEKLWHLAQPGDAAYRVPPLAHIANGPSGLTYHPGTGLLPDRYRDHFFLCDFRGSAAGSGIHAFAVRPKGAAFELVERERFLWGVLATDTDFGPDGALYLCDWVEGWGLTGKGRIYKVSDPRRADDPVAAEVKRLLAEGMAGRPLPALAKLLAHPDRRIHQEAQFALADRGAEALPTLLDIAHHGKDRLARLHAVWAVGQVGRKQTTAGRDFPAAGQLGDLTADGDAEVRAQAAKVLGEIKAPASAARLVPLLRDAEPHVRLLAALGLAKVGRAADVAAVLDMLRDNADADPYLRHAGVMALVGINDRDALRSAARDVSPAVRMASLLAMRRLEMPEVARFLADADSRLVVEAARAINDVPINAGLPELAVLSRRTGLSEPVLYRVINANFRLGKRENAAALATLAGRPDLSEAVRLEALRALRDWANPPPLDRVVGLSRPLPPRPAADATEALRPALGGIFTAPDRVRAEGARLAARLGIREVGPALLDLVTDRRRAPPVRIEALKALQTLKDERLPRAMQAALADPDGRLRGEGRRVLAARDPQRALPELEKALQVGTLPERQAALDTLGHLPLPAADATLGRWLDKLLAGQVPAEISLDLLEAAGRRQAPAVRQKLARYEAARPKGDSLAPYREALAGGDAEAGGRLFRERTDLSCVRCHKVGGVGGEVGPDLGGIGSRQTREYLLESIVAPDRQIAKGYETVVLELSDGTVRSGILKGEDARQVRLLTAEGALVSVPTADIEGRSRGPSAMPADLVQHLSKAELRDLVEFLSSLR
jgi:quinoprotein glucose dehydrogenase